MPELEGKYVHSVVFDGKRPERVFVYVAVEGAPLFRSDDRGKTWQQIGSGLPDGGPADAFALHPDDGNTPFYAGKANGEGRLFVSHDIGEKLGGASPYAACLAAPCRPQRPEP